jgi:hypothetical protein
MMFIILMYSNMISSPENVVPKWLSKTVRVDGFPELILSFLGDFDGRNGHYILRKNTNIGK